MTPPRTRAAGALALLVLALALAGCAGPLPDETEQPEAGYPSQTERPPPGAPNEPLFPDPMTTPLVPDPPG